MAELKTPDLNKVILAGRLTRDPELRYLPTGAAVCTMGLAVSRITKTKGSDKHEETMFINVETWEKTAEYCGKHLKKGRPLLVEGRLRSREWEDKATGQKRSVIEVRAERVQQLDWDDESKPRAATRRDVPEPQPEDDIPF